MRIISNVITCFFIMGWFLISSSLTIGFEPDPKKEPVHICFEQDAGLIEVEQLTGSSMTTFKIPRKGYETMEQRRRAYYDRLEKEEELLPVNALYFFEFYATMYPEEENRTYLQEIHCRTPEDLREGKIEMENDSQLIFIREVPDKNVLVWKDVKTRNRI